jgi:hypothetical protein
MVQRISLVGPAHIGQVSRQYWFVAQAVALPLELVVQPIPSYARQAPGWSRLAPAQVASQSLL